MLDSIDGLDKTADFGREPIDGSVETYGHAGQHGDLIFDRAKPIQDALQLARQKIERNVRHPGVFRFLVWARRNQCARSDIPVK